MRRAVFRHIYGGNSMIHRIPGRVIVNISIRSIPTTHAHAYQSVASAGALWEFRAHLTVWRTSCCYLFAHYITLLPSRVSLANLHYKCRRCYHRSLMRALWRRWRILNSLIWLMPSNHLDNLPRLLLDFTGQKHMYPKMVWPEVNQKSKICFKKFVRHFGINNFAPQRFCHI